MEGFANVIAGTTMDPDHPAIDRWILELDSPDLGTRIAAYRGLAEQGDARALSVLAARAHDIRGSGVRDERGIELSHGQLAEESLRRLLHRRPDLRARRPPGR